MSVMIVHSANIDAVMTFVMKNKVYGTAHTWHHICRLAQIDAYDWDDSATKIGQLIYDMNVKSFNDRYLQSAHVEKFDKIPYIYHKRAESTMQVIKCLDFIIYQCGEATGFEGSLVSQILTCIRDTTISELPGYDDAKWGIS